MMSPQRIADAGVAVSATSAGWTWLGHANELAQFGASVVAIVSGIAAVVYYTSKFLRERSKDSTE